MALDLEHFVPLTKIRQFAPQAVEDGAIFRGEVTLTIRAQDLSKVCQLLRDDPELNFKFLSDVTSVDHYPVEPRFETIYHLLSFKPYLRLRIKVRLPGDDPHVASTVPIWPGANAFEREVYDLMGIRFDGHPNMTRMLLPDDFEGHPLRKDYPTEGFR